VRDVVEVAGVDADVLIPAVDLDPDPVELPFHRRTIEAPDRLGHARGGGGEHRKDGPEDLEPHAAKPTLALGDRDLGGAHEIAREHQRTARKLAGDLGRFRDRVDHQPGERALPQLAREQPSYEVGFLLGRPAEERAENQLTLCRRSSARRVLNLGDRAVEIVNRQRCLCGRRPLDAVNGRVADADSALPGHAGEEADRDRDLALVEPPQEPGEDGDLFRARTRVAQVPRGGDYFGEQRHR
jgi:hypothetical protein